MKNVNHDTKHKLDVFITLHKKDLPALTLCVQSILRYLHPKAKRIVVISKEIPHDILMKYNGVEFLHESNVFDRLTLAQIPKIIHGNENRAGWYFQQFLKWEARKYSKTNDYAVVDADTAFIRPMILVRNNKYVFYRSAQYHMPYFKTYEKLFGYLPEKQQSFIANYMIFNAEVVDEIITQIERTCSGEKKWYEIILDAIDKNEPSSFSEFETYGYYMSNFYHNLFESRESSNKILEKESMPYHWIHKIIYKLRGYLSISYHNYIR